MADGYVSGVAPGSSVEIFKAQFNSSVTVKDGNGKIDSTDYISIKRHIFGIAKLGQIKT